MSDMNIFFRSNKSKSVFIAVVALMLMVLGTSCKEKPLSEKKAVDNTDMANQETDNLGFEF